MVHIRTLHELFPTEEDKEAFLRYLTMKTFWGAKVETFLDSSHTWLKDNPQAYVVVEDDASSQTDTVNDRVKLAESTGLDLFTLNDLYFRTLLAKHTELRDKTDELIKSLLACKAVEDLDELGCKTFPGEWTSNATSSQGKARTLKAKDDKVTYIKGTDSGTGVKIPCFTRPIAYPELFADRTDEELRCHALDLTTYVRTFATRHLKDKYHDKDLYSDIEAYLLNNTLPEKADRQKLLKGVEYCFFVYSALGCITPTEECIKTSYYSLDSRQRYARLLQKHLEDVALNLFEHAPLELDSGTNCCVRFEESSYSVFSGRYTADDYNESMLSKVVVENVIKPILHEEYIKSCLVMRGYSWDMDPVVVCLESPSKTRISEDATDYDEFMGRLFAPKYQLDAKGMTSMKVNPGVMTALMKIPTGDVKRQSLDAFYKQITWFNDHLSQDITTQEDESFNKLFKGGITEQEVLDGTAHFVVFLTSNSVIDLGVFLRENIKPTLLLHHTWLSPIPNENGGVDYIIGRDNYCSGDGPESAFYILVDNEEQKAVAEELMLEVINNTCTFTKGSLDLRYEIIVVDQNAPKFPEFNSVVQNRAPMSTSVSAKDKYDKDCFERDLLKEQALYYKFVLNSLESSDDSYLKSHEHFMKTNDLFLGIGMIQLDNIDGDEGRDTASKGLIELSNSASYDSALFVMAGNAATDASGLIIRRPGLLTCEYLPRLCEDGRLRYEKVDEGVYFVPIRNSPYYGGGRYSYNDNDTFIYLPVYVKGGVAEWLYPSEIPNFIPVVRDICNEIDAMSTELLMAYAFETSIIKSGENTGFFGEVTGDAI